MMATSTRFTLHDKEQAGLVESVSEEVLRLGTDDWVSFAAIEGAWARRGSTTPREHAIETIRELMTNSAGRIGVYVNGEGLVRWDISPDEAAERIESYFGAAQGRDYINASMELMLDVYPG